MVFRYLMAVLGVLAFLGCAPEGYTVVRGAAEAGPPDEVMIEMTTERVYNCGEGGDTVVQTPAAFSMIADSVQWDLGLELGVSRDLALVALEGELAARYGAEYKVSTQIGTGWELPARPGEWLEYTLRWSEVWQLGNVVLRSSGAEETVAYRYRKAIKSEIVGKRLLGCPASVATPAVTAAVPLTPQVQVVGYGYPPATMTNAGQRRAAALRAAELDAKRKLAEWLTGAEIEAVTVIEASTVMTDEVRMTVQAHLRGVTILHQTYSAASGQAEVTLAPVTVQE